MMLSSAAALFTLLLQLPASTGEVRGQVRSEGTGEVIPGATVEILEPRSRATATDADGQYRLDGIEPGRRTIRARRVGYAPLEMVVMVPAEQSVEVDITLRTVPIVLEPVHVGGRRRGVGTDTSSAGSGDLAMAGARAIQSSPGLAEIGLGDALARVPGHHPPNPSDVLFVRGAGTDMKLVYLDGAPVYAPFPLGGLLAPFSPELLASAEVYLGGAPARYDGGLSYILDLRTRGARADRMHSSGSVDLLSARALVETPVGEGAALLLSGRGVHGAGAGWTADGGLPYGYREGLARADVSLGSLGELSFTVFGNGERVWVDSARADSRAVQWGNGSGSLRYLAAVGGATELEVTGALAEFSARLPIATAGMRVAEGFSRRTRLALDATSRMELVTLRYGLSFESQRQHFRARALELSTGSWEPVGSVVQGEEAGAYFDAGVRVAPRLLLRGGVRADRFSLGERLVLAPRAAATLLLTDHATLTLAGGRYHQYLRPSDAALLAGSDQLPLHSPEPLALARASHLALAIDQDLGEGVRLGLEGFYKSYEDVPSGEPSDVRSSGMDFWMRRDSGAWRGWLGYSLAWTWAGLRDGSSQFSGRHLVSTGLTAPVGDRARVDLGVVYGAGLPYSAIPLSGQETGDRPLMGDAPTPYTGGGMEPVNAGNAPLLAAPSQPYLRVDLGASGTWSPAWGRGGVEFTPYVRLLNTLGHRDALFYRADEDGGVTNPVAILPLVPVIGMEWKF